MYYFNTQNLAVGYNGKVLIKDINVGIEKGSIMTLIGPNGAGKSTILKTITRQLERIDGSVHIGDNDVWSWNLKEMARSMAVVLTDRIQPELMTCEEIVAMGRYPYTNSIGRLTAHDADVVNAALRRVHALELADHDFMTLSDGQRQRIMLARAIAQEPDVIVLDEPTSYLDIRYKIELLDILRDMAHSEGITVIMTLHEIDLATKISDYLLCIKGEKIAAFGSPEEILTGDTIDRLYEIEHGSYDILFGSVELGRTTGKPRAFVIGGNGYGANSYRSLQKHQIPFAAGILFENDTDWRIATALSNHVISGQAFEPLSEELFDKAAGLMLECEYVIDTGCPVGTLNAMNGRLLELAVEKGMDVRRGC